MISAGRLGHPSGPKVGGGGLPPQLLEPRRVGGGVADVVLDVAVAEVVLDQPGVRALVGPGVAAGVAQHVRVGGQAGRGNPARSPYRRTASHAVLRLKGPRRSLTKKASVAGCIAFRSASHTLIARISSGAAAGSWTTPSWVFLTKTATGQFCDSHTFFCS